MKRSTVWALLSVLLLLLAQAANAQAPTRVPFQGLLLDAGGTPVTDVVDLDFSLHDAVVAGSQLWSESHSGVQVVDGVYSVELGSTTPITGSVLSGGAAFLEIVVDGETMTPRQQLLSVPYALVAEDVNQVAGLSSVFVSEFLEHSNLDGGDPPNLDPREGIGDADGDGIANFMDNDNDDDGYSDSQELALGQDINVPNPRITSITPNGTVPTLGLTTFTLEGTNLGTATTVQIGSDLEAPYNVTPTSLDFDYTAAAAAVVTVTATMANGDTATAPGSITFADIALSVFRPEPRLLRDGEATTVTLHGNGFITGMTVEVDGAPVTPNLVSQRTLEVPVASPTGAGTLIELFHPNRPSTPDVSQTLPIVPAGSKYVFLTPTTYQGDFGGPAAADAICQAAADLYSYSGTYKAWISDSTSSPAATFTQSVAPYYNLAAARVADDWSDLVTGIDAPINETPIGSSSANAWTGTFGTGQPIVGDIWNCEDWSTLAATQTGRYGQGTNLTGESWTSVGSSFCNATFALICVQQ